LNFFKLYIGDYQRDTAHLSVTEHGAYLLMLQHYYATEKPLPVGKALHRMLRAQDKAEREAIDTVVAQFWQETDDGLVNERADVEITKAGAQAETNRTIAQAREAKRKASREGNDKSTNRATNDQPNQNHSHSQTPDKSNRHTEQREMRQANDDSPVDWEAWRKWFEVEHGVEHDPYSTAHRSKFRPLAQAWVNAGVTIPQMRAAIAKAKREATEPITYLPGYVDRVLATMQTPTKPATQAELNTLAHGFATGVYGPATFEPVTQSEPEIVDVESRLIAP